MKRIYLYINNQLADYDKQIQIIVDKVVKDFGDVLKKTGLYSYTIKLPVTQNNKKIFSNAQHVHTLEKFKTTYAAKLFVNDNLIIDGVFNFREIDGGYYIGNIQASKVQSISDIIPDKSLRDIQSFEPIEFRGDATIYSYLNRNLEWYPSYVSNSNKSEICFPLVPNSSWKFNNLNYYNSIQTIQLDPEISLGTGYEDFPPAFFAGSILENIVKDAGYTLQGNILNSAELKKLVLLYSNENNEEIPYNYSTLNPFTSTVDSGSNSNLIYQDATNTEIDRGNAFNNLYNVYCHDLPFSILTGDLSYSSRLRATDISKTYIPKFTGTYTFTANVNFRNLTTYSLTSSPNNFVTDNSQNVNILIQNYFALVEVDNDNLYLEESFIKLPFSDIFNGGGIFIPRSNDKTKLNSVFGNGYTTTENDGSLTVTFNGECELEKGKQYRLQLYSVYKHQNGTILQNYFVQVNTGSFNLTACEAEEEITLTKFLPEIKQIDFMNAMFKRFNLFHSIDNSTLTVTLYTRDEFFNLNSTNTIDLSKRCNINLFKQTPVDAATVLSTQFQYSKDDVDYLLENKAINQTFSYLELVNDSSVTTSYTLPFSPLTFFYNSQYSQPLPFVFTKENESGNNLNEVGYDNNFAYKPRLAFFHNNPYPTGFSVPTISFARNNTLVSTPFPAVKASRLTFWNVVEQPYFTYNYFSGITFTSTSAATSIANVANYSSQDAFNSLENTGLQIAANSYKSLYNQLYRKTLLINTYSNYYEGEILMDDILFNRLDGKSIIRIENDLYLLESITDYDLINGFAKIKVIKLI